MSFTDKVKNEAGQPMWNDIAHFGIPAGPNGPTPPYFVPFSQTHRACADSLLAIARSPARWVAKLHVRPTVTP